MVVAVGLLAAAAVTVPVYGSSAGPVTVKVAFTAVQSWGPLFIADREGYFVREGLRVDWVTFAGGADTVAVLLQGGIDVGAGAASAAFMNAVARGERIRIVADKGHVAAGFKEIGLVVRRGLTPEGAAALPALRGRRVAVNTIGSVLHYILAKSLARAGMALSDIQLVRLPFPAIVVALQQGGVDAAVLPEPFLTQSVEIGAARRVLSAGEVVPDEPIAFLFYGPTLLDRSPDVGRRFMVAYLRGVRDYVAGPTERNVQTIAAYTKVDAAIIRKGGWFPIAPDARVNINAIRRFQDWLYEQELIGVRNPVTALVDTSFLTHALGVLPPR